MHCLCALGGADANPGRTQYSRVQFLVEPSTNHACPLGDPMAKSVEIGRWAIGGMLWNERGALGVRWVSRR